MRDFITVAKAIADPTRARILKMLEDGDLCVCHITERLGLAQSTVSKHLQLLRGAGLVADRKEGLWVYYRLETGPMNPYNLAFLQLVRQSLPEEKALACGELGQKPPACCP